MAQSYQITNKGQKITKFWEQLEQGKLLTTKCSCGQIHWPPRTFCNNCYDDKLDWIELPLNGRLINWTTVKAPPNKELPQEYTLGIVELPLKGVKLFGMFNPDLISPQLEYGLPIKITFRKQGEFIYFTFEEDIDQDS